MDIHKTEFGLYKTYVDGSQYEFTKWGAELALDTLMDLSNLIGGPLGDLLGSTGGRTDVELTGEALDLAVKSLTGAMQKNRTAVMDNLKKLCAHEVFCQGKPVGSFDFHYKGKLPHMFKVARANLEVQYGDFLSELGINAEKMAALMPKAKAAPDFPTPSPSAPTTA